VRELNGTLADVHDAWQNYKVCEHWLAVFFLWGKHAIWRVENHIEAGQYTNVPQDVPRHSFSDSRLDIITAITDKRLENGINNLTDKNNEASFILTEVDGLDKVNSTKLLPDANNEVV
jgi:hypothetical protein